MELASRAIAGACLWCISASLARAQAPASERLVEVGGAFATRVRNEDPSVGMEVQRSMAWARLNVPVPIADGTALLFGLSYEGQFVEYGDFATRTVDGITLTRASLPTPLHSLDASVGLHRRLAERWSVAARFTPGLHSDFGRVEGRDILWGGSLLFLHAFGAEVRPGERNRIGFGLAFTDRFGSRLPVPLLALDWYPSPRWFVRGTPPMDLDAGYRFSPALAAGVGALLKGSMYRLERAPFDGRVLRYRELQLGPFVDLAFTRRLHVRVNAGVSAGHTLELRDASNDRTLLSGTFSSSAFFRGSLYYAP